MEKKALAALYDFENKVGVFADVHRSFKFSVLLLNGSDRQTEAADFVFFARSIEDLKPRDRHIVLSARDLKLLNPNTRTCPIFRTRRDCELTKRIYRNIPILIDENRKKGGNPWAIKFVTMFHQTNDAEHFRTAQSLKDDGFRLEGNRWLRVKKFISPLRSQNDPGLRPSRPPASLSKVRVDAAGPDRRNDTGHAQKPRICRNAQVLGCRERSCRRSGWKGLITSRIHRV
jgi:hypothetical protein